MDLDFTTDFTVWDNVEAGTYYPRTSESPVTYGAGVALANVLREVGHGDEAGPNSALLTNQTTAIHVSQVQLGTTVPKVGDRYVSPDTTSFIIQPGGEYEQAMTQLWRLPVQREI